MRKRPRNAKQLSRIRPLLSNEIEAANRAEVTALLIRAGYRVYRPEADCYGEDLILRAPDETLRVVHLKSAPCVNWMKYGQRSLWMLFPDPESGSPRKWFLVLHDRLYKWTKAKHDRAPKWNEEWRFPYVPKALARFLDEFAIIHSSTL